jgi:acyl carrier protein
VAPQGAGAAVAELGLTPEEGCAAFARIMDVPGLDRVVVSTGNLQHRIEQWVTAGQNTTTQSSIQAHGKRPDLLGTAISPSSPTEMGLADLWQQLLGIEGIGTADNFFELGGNSLVLTQLVALIRRTFQVDLPLQELFSTPTITDIAAQIDAQRVDFDGDDGERDVGEI